MNRKRSSAFLTGFLCCLLALGAGMQAVGSQAAPGAAKPGGLQSIEVSENVKLEVEGEPFVPESGSGRELPVFLYDGAAYAPVRALSERLGYRVYYSEKSRTARMEPEESEAEKERLFLYENMDKRMAQVKTIEFRDQEGRRAVVDALADPDPNDASFSWLDRLWRHGYYTKISTENNEKPEDYQGSGIDVVFLDEDGDCVCKYEDISERYMTCLGEYYCKGFSVIDMERVRRVLEGLPDTFEPENPIHIGQASWIILSGGDRGKGKTVRIDDPEIIAEITQRFNATECQREDTWYAQPGNSPTFTWYSDSGEIIDSVGIRSPTLLEYGKFYRKVTSAPLDMELCDRLLEEMPAANWTDYSPIMTFSSALEAQHVRIENGAKTLSVEVSDPELLKRLAENIGGIRFRVGGHLASDPYAPAEDGRIFLEWLTNNGPEEEYGVSSLLFPLCILDGQNIQFTYWNIKGNEYAAAAMDGKTIDKQLLDDLLDPNGPYADNPQVKYQTLSGA